MIAARGARVWRGMGAAVVMAVFAFPVYWMVVTSLRRQSDVRSTDVDVLPSALTLDNYRTVFDRDFFDESLRTSLIVTALTVSGALLFAFLAAVALARFRFRGRKSFIVAVLAVQMVPAEAMVISLFQILDGWQLVNTITGLTLTYLAFVLPFTIWTLRGFVAGIPLDLEEAAMVDGASRCGPSSPSPFPSSPLGSWPRASSPSSRPGTSSSTPS